MRRHDLLARWASSDSQRPKLSLQRVEDSAPIAVAFAEDSELLAELLNAPLKRGHGLVVADCLEPALDKNG